MDRISSREYMEMYNVIGAAMRVHEVLGRGLEELVYQEALGIEFKKRGIEAKPQYPIHCYYDGIMMEKKYVADYYYNNLVIELKSTEELCAEHRAQLFNYMRLTHTKRGVLINFGEKKLHAERFVYNNDNDDFILLTRHNYRDYINL